VRPSAGRSIEPLEAVAASVLLVLTFVRTVVWAADGARLTRQVLRTEAYFRTLVHSAADITIVLDHRGQITWASGAGRSAAAWAARDLEGRELQEFVHAEDRAQLLHVLDPTADPDDVSGRAFRLRTKDGGWRHLETPHPPGCPSGCGPGRRPSRRRGAPVTAWCCTCATSMDAGRPSSSSSGWPTPTT
jgi:PAS domain S-box-containing protein